MKTKNIISIFIIFSLILLVLPSVNAYLFRTSGIDGPTYNSNGQFVYLNPISIDVGGVTQTGNPTNFNNINANAVYSVTYSAPGYITDVDQVYFDVGLPGCSGTSCSLSSNGFDTACTYNVAFSDWTCVVTDVSNGQWSLFLYNKNDLAYGEVVRTVNSMYPIGQAPSPSPVITDIPNININEDGTFSITLDNFVSDADNLDSQLTWSVSGNTNVIVNIVNRVATISLPVDWFGSESLTFSVIDPDGNTDSDGVTVTVASVNDLSVVSIGSPASGSSFEEGDSITFTGSANDVEDGVLSGSNLVWSSSLDGVIGTGTSVTTSSLSVGTHVISLTVTDLSGGVSVYTISVIITEEVSVSAEDNEEDKSHSVRINSVNMNSEVNCGDVVDVVVDLNNNGDYSEDVHVSITNSELELNKNSDEIRIKKSKDSSAKLSFNVPNNAKGEYAINVRAYYDGKSFYSTRLLNINCGSVSSTSGEIVNVEEDGIGDLIIILTWILAIIVLLAIIIYMITLL